MSLGSNESCIISSVYTHDLFQMAVFSPSFLGNMKQYLLGGGEDYFCLILCITYQSKEKNTSKMKKKNKATGNVIMNSKKKESDIYSLNILYNSDLYSYEKSAGFVSYHDTTVL